MSNKKQERSARKNNNGKNGYRKSGGPAKAGKRKVYGPLVLDKNGEVLSGRRKTKSFEATGGIIHSDVTMKNKGFNQQIFCDRWYKGQKPTRTMTGAEVNNLFN
jgi:hypothetical protein